MAKITIRRNFKFADLAKEVMPSAREMRRAGEELATRIENRTLGGRDENGQPFAPLAQPKYGKDRADLHDTGRMFADFGVTHADAKGFKLGFRSKRSERIAEYHQYGTGRMPARPFLGVPERWVTEMLRRWLRRR